MERITDTYILNNGYHIPCLGFGTWQSPNGETATAAVRTAVRAGYRHIDTAAAYKNESSIGEALKPVDIPRAELFITSKVWDDSRGYEKTMKSFQKTLDDLQTDYLDLYLIHWPATKYRCPDWEAVNVDTWRAMTELYKKGYIKSIGVSNFLPEHLEALMQTEIIPMVDQIEYHPGQMQEETVDYCRKHDILVEAWSPLGTGRMLTDRRLQDIASKYGKSVAQLCIRWCLQNGVLPLPKSVTPSRIVENADIFDFHLSDEDMVTINSMPYFGGSGLHPNTR
ncbi:glyoxal reductase [Clostridiales bacterium 1_7_47FAA]|uniref:Aldo/keto reductase n=1 Tax=Enterocloster hominis (ex Hitch et al. 2024) TaxID=1917870 RepID=A0ABV1D3U4_9FIRM|nr:glyoxal reductase [Clostridiales bacterium 1_7_47FAA]